MRHTPHAFDVFDLCDSLATVCMHISKLAILNKQDAYKNTFEKGSM